MIAGCYPEVHDPLSAIVASRAARMPNSYAAVAAAGLDMDSSAVSVASTHEMEAAEDVEMTDAESIKDEIADEIAPENAAQAAKDKAPTTLHPFFKLPDELKLKIYGYALATGKPISPHLCHTKLPGDWKTDMPDGPVKFHDDAQDDHDAINKLLGLTRVSKKIREESLPIFYQVNTFRLCEDILVYFEHLKKIGRMDWVHHVEFDIWTARQRYVDYIAPVASRAITSVDKHIIREHEPYTKETLKTHPLYTSGGLSEIGLWLLMRKLSISNTTTPGLPRKLTLQVVSKKIFDCYNIQWFLDTAAKLGIELRFVEGFGMGVGAPWFRLGWSRKCQGRVEKVEDVVAVEEGGGEGEVDGRRRTVYFRRPCRVGDTIEWFDVFGV